MSTANWVSWIPFFAALIAAVGAIAVSASTYWFTKQKEHEADLRKEKIAHYRALFESLSRIVDGDATDDGHLAFAKSTNTLFLVAPQKVMKALYELRDELAISNRNTSRDHHDVLLTQLVLEIRKDLRIEPDDDSTPFVARLYSSGVKQQENK